MLPALAKARAPAAPLQLANSSAPSFWVARASELNMNFTQHDKREDCPASSWLAWAHPLKKKLFKNSCLIERLYKDYSSLFSETPVEHWEWEVFYRNAKYTANLTSNHKAGEVQSWAEAKESPWWQPLVYIIIYHLSLRLLHYHKRGKKEPCIQLALTTETTRYTLPHCLAHTVDSATAKVRMGHWKQNEITFACLEGITSF